MLSSRCRRRRRNFFLSILFEHSGQNKRQCLSCNKNLRWAKKSDWILDKARTERKRVRVSAENVAEQRRISAYTQSVYDKANHVSVISPE